MSDRDKAVREAEVKALSSYTLYMTAHEHRLVDSMVEIAARRAYDLGFAAGLEKARKKIIDRLHKYRNDVSLLDAEWDGVNTACFLVDEVVAGLKKGQDHD